MNASTLGQPPRFIATLTLTALTVVVGCSAGGRDREDGATQGSNNGDVPYYNGPDTSNEGAQPEDPPAEPPLVEGPPDLDLMPSTGRLGSAAMVGSGQSTDRWRKTDVSRDGKNYFFMA